MAKAKYIFYADAIRRQNISLSRFFKRILKGIHQPDISLHDTNLDRADLDIFADSAYSLIQKFQSTYPETVKVFRCVDTLSIHDRVTVYETIFDYLRREILSYDERSSLELFVQRNVRVAFYQGILKVFPLTLPEHMVTRFIEAWEMKIDHPAMTCNQLYRWLKDQERGQMINKVSRVLPSGELVDRHHPFVQRRIMEYWRMLKQIAHEVVHECTCHEEISEDLVAPDDPSQDVELREKIAQTIHNLEDSEKLGLALYTKAHNLPPLEEEISLDMLLAWLTLSLEERQQWADRATEKIKALFLN